MVRGALEAGENSLPANVWGSGQRLWALLKEGEWVGREQEEPVRRSEMNTRAHQAVLADWFWSI